MIRWVETRLIIEKPLTHEKYYPSVLRASTQKSYPFSISYAEIEIASNIIGSTSSYINQLRFDDIIRLQVSIKYNPNQRTVWQDLFQGRIMDLSGELSDNSNSTTIYAQGHEVEAIKALIEETKTFSTTTNARDVLKYFTQTKGYLKRLTYSDSYASNAISFVASDNTAYDTKANQTYMSDLFSDMEKVAGYDYAIKAIPTYSGGNLSTVYISWQPFDSTVTDKYKVIEGTSRVLSSNFEVSGTEFITAFRENGDTPSGGTQYTGYASDAALIAQYGTRTDIDTQTWINSNSLCNTIAAGLLAEGIKLDVSGEATLIGTPECDICDLVQCKFPSIELNGASVSANLTVKRVSHLIDGNEFSTFLDFEKVKKTVNDYIGQVSKTVKTCKKNQIK